jgi:hypothetical protein
MLKWLLALIAFLFPASPVSETDYVGRIAAEAAYANLLPSATPAKPKVPTKDCTTCNGTGRIRTGDDQNWTKCPDCEGTPTGDIPLPPGVKTPKSEPDRYRGTSVR